jgi:hypothetical protein
VAAKQIRRKRKPLPTAEIVRLLGIANDNRDQQAAQLRRMVPDKISGIADEELPTEAERYKARKDLLKEFQWQYQQVGGKQIAAIDPYLVQAVKDWAFRIFAKPKPARELEYFFGMRQRPGKRPANVNRNFQITADVIAKMDAGMTLENAAAAVASTCPLTVESIATIYKRYQRALRSRQLEERAVVAMRKIERNRGRIFESE